MKPRTKILVDLDSLLDTRFGTITGMDLDLSVNVLKAGWRDRLTDNISELVPDFPMTVFNDLYKNRNLDTLATSLITMMVVHIQDLTHRLEEVSTDNPKIGLPQLVVNIHPYSFSTEEQAELCKMVKQYVSPLCIVSTIAVDPIKLTPTTIDEHYDSVIMYHYQDWLTAHTPALEKKQIPNVTFFVPVILAVSDLEAVTDHDIFKGHSIPKLMKDYLNHYLCLEMMDTQYFSIVDPDRVERHNKAKGP